MGGICVHERVYPASERASEATGSQLSIDRGTPRKKGQRFQCANLPLTSGLYHRRREVERRILSDLIEVCNHPEKDILAITGEPGVGKTSLVSYVLSASGPMKDISAELNHKTVVLWLNCLQWQGEIFDEEAQQNFDDQLREVAKNADPEFNSYCIHNIPGYFKRKKDMQVLFVLDDMLNANLLQYFLKTQQQAKSQPSICLLTRNSNLKQKPIKFVKLEAMSNGEIEILFEQTFKLDDKLLPEQMIELSKKCQGSPLIASLVAACFSSAGEDVTQLAQTYIDLLATLDIEELVPSQLSFNAVVRMYDLIVNRLDNQTLSNSFLAFLLFEAEHAAPLADLKLFWGIEAYVEIISNQYLKTANENERPKSPREIEAARQTTMKTLLTAISVNLETCKFINVQQKSSVTEKENRKNSEPSYTIHQMLWEAALDKATRQFIIERKLSKEERLQKVRMKLLQSGTSNSDHSEMILFEAVRQRRLDLMARCIEVISPNNLALLSRCHSKKPEDATKSTFLQFLYHSIWIEPGSTDENVSWILLRKILTKLKRGLALNELWKAVSLQSLGSFKSNDELTSCFINDLFQDETNQTNADDRQPLISLMNCFRNNFTEEQWKANALATGSPLVKVAIKGDKEAFAKIYSQLPPLDEDTLAEVATAAARCNRLNVLKLLCDEKGVKVTSLRDAGHWSPTVIAASKGHVDVVKFLCEQDAKVVSERGSSNGTTPMIAACNCGNLEIVNYIYEKDPTTIIQTDANDVPTIHFAIESGNVELVRFILAKEPRLLEITEGSSGLPPVIYAADNLELVRLIVQVDPDRLKDTNRNGGSLMLAAAKKGNLEVVKFCHQKDPNMISKEDQNGMNPLLTTAAEGRLEVAKFICQHSSKLISQVKVDGEWNGATAVMLALNGGHVNMAKLIFETQPEAGSTKRADGWTVLMLACMKQNFTLIRYFCENDPSAVRQVANDGTTAMIVACRYAEVEAVKYLAKLAPSMASQADNNGSTPLVWACSNNLEIVKYLVELVPETLNQPSKDGTTPFLKACECNQLSIVKFLYERDLNVLSQRDKAGRSAIEVANPNLSQNQETVDYLKTITSH